MAEAPILRDLVILFAAALPIVFIFQRLNIPSVVGFLIAGIVIGPHGIALIAHSEDVENLAELGLVLLLFVVGLELSFSQLTRLGGIILWSGGLQVVVTVAGVCAAAVAWGVPAPQALFIGFLVVQSSTAIVLKMLSDRGELHAPHGRIAVGILLIQDLCLVPMMLLTRLLATPAAASWIAVAMVLVKGAAAVAVIVLVSRLLIPGLLRQIVRLRSRELFTGAVVLFCLGTAWLASRFGLSLALGALIAGLVISESEYSHQVTADILPFRDAFNSVFFISIGMLLRMDFLMAHLSTLVAGAVAVYVLKLLISVAVILPFYGSFRIAATTAFCLAHIGELSFVLTRFALPLGIMPPAEYETFVAVAVLTMLAAPFLIHVAPAAAERVEALLGIPEPVTEVDTAPARNHVLIIGYGLNGENVAHVLEQTGVPYIILELNPERVRTARERNEPIRYGDATRLEVLHKAGAASAHVIVIAISDPVATRRIVALARQLNEEVPIVVRTRYVAEIDQLRQLGATEVIPEEFETSVEIFARVLRRLRVPRNVIALQVELIRKQSYSMLRGLALPKQTLDQLDRILAATTTESFMVWEGSPAAGRTIRQLQLRRTTGVTIIAVVRDGRPFTNPAPDLTIQAGDILVMLGSHAQLDRALSRLGESGEGPPA